MTPQEFYCCQVPRWLGSARSKITGKRKFNPLTHDEIFALVLWADYDVLVEVENGQVTHWDLKGPLEITIDDGRFEVRYPLNKMEEKDDY